MGEGEFGPFDDLPEFECVQEERNGTDSLYLSLRSKECWCVIEAKTTGPSCVGVGRDVDDFV